MVLKIGGGRGGEQGESPRARADGEARRDEAARPALRVASRMAELRLRRGNHVRERPARERALLRMGLRGRTGLIVRAHRVNGVRVGCACGRHPRVWSHASRARCLGDGAMDGAEHVRYPEEERRDRRCAACGGSTRPPGRERENEIETKCSLQPFQTSLTQTKSLLTRSHSSARCWRGATE